MIRVVAAADAHALVSPHPGGQLVPFERGSLAREVFRKCALFHAPYELPRAEPAECHNGRDRHEGRQQPGSESRSARVQHRAILAHPNNRGRPMSGIKWLVLVIFFAIVLSLVSAMLSLVRDHTGESRGMVRALSIRIGLSIVLFIVLWMTWKMGWIEPHAVGG